VSEAMAVKKKCPMIGATKYASTCRGVEDEDQSVTDGFDIPKPVDCMGDKCGWWLSVKRSDGEDIGGSCAIAWIGDHFCTQVMEHVNEVARKRAAEEQRAAATGRH